MGSNGLWIRKCWMSIQQARPNDRVYWIRNCLGDKMEGLELTRMIRIDSLKTAFWPVCYLTNEVAQITSDPDVETSGRGVHDVLAVS